jgi:predicted nucleic acid-binding protein
MNFERIEEVEYALAEVGCRLASMPREALFLAGKAFLTYRRRGGTKRSPLPDFFIGAHAAAHSLPLITRNKARYQAYFPSVKLISP